MNLINTIRRIEYLDSLIRKEQTGKPDELASKLGISVRTLYGYLSDLKQIGIPIGFNKSRNSYVYTISGKFRFGFSSEDPPELRNQNIEKIPGNDFSWPAGKQY